VEHDGVDLFEGLESPLLAGRYHSLVAERSSLPPELRVTAWTRDGAVMALRHVERPLFGVQFHPESVLTPDGNRLLGNFVRLAFKTLNIKALPTMAHPEGTPR
jgi:anthranilate/para-aminobenzoate synthase component II